jgi:hypothetical protein
VFDGRQLTSLIWQVSRPAPSEYTSLQRPRWGLVGQLNELLVCKDRTFHALWRCVSSPHPPYLIPSSVFQQSTHRSVIELENTSRGLRYSAKPKAEQPDPKQSMWVSQTEVRFYVYLVCFFGLESGGGGRDGRGVEWRLSGWRLERCMRAMRRMGDEVEWIIWQGFEWSLGG